MKRIPDDEVWVMPPDHSILADLLEESQRIVANSRTNYPHRGGVGDYRESLFCELFTSRLPQNISTCKGVVQDSKGEQTSEFDILLFKPEYRMVIAKAEDHKLVLPVESVIAAIEIRSRIDKSAVRSAVEKTGELAKLTRYFTDLGSDFCRMSESIGIGARHDGPNKAVQRIPVLLIGFDSVSSESVEAELESHDEGPDVVACLGKFLISRFLGDEDPMLFEAPHTELSMIMLHLTGHILRAHRDQPMPDLLKYFRLPLPSAIKPEKV
jgi:hypothetical protein